MRLGLYYCSHAQKKKLREGTQIWKILRFGNMNREGTQIWRRVTQVSLFQVSAIWEILRVSDIKKKMSLIRE